MDMKDNHLKIRPANIGYRYRDAPLILEVNQQSKKAISQINIDLDKVNDSKQSEENTSRRVILNKQQQENNSSTIETLKMQESPAAN